MPTNRLLSCRMSISCVRTSKVCDTLAGRMDCLRPPIAQYALARRFVYLPSAKPHLQLPEYNEYFRCDLTHVNATNRYDDQARNLNGHFQISSKMLCSLFCQKRDQIQ
ncbi:hypothetical protein AVEN_175744-1 [Araneus ventricosus]|uniref:Uncharacterized protein n=1 Tax=Araneus ventricosus TaxID=182803 RepID=A0A4Y2M6B4_ARAVE|nr:hypothetical protein AVEN_175744-1 [Araneus ventricosus]